MDFWVQPYLALFENNWPFSGTQKTIWYYYLLNHKKDLLTLSHYEMDACSVSQMIPITSWEG